MRNKKTNAIEYELKLRGIKQDIFTDLCMPYEAYKKKVLNFGKEETTYFWQQVFMPRLKEGKVYTKMALKSYDVVCKSIIDDRAGSFYCYAPGY